MLIAMKKENYFPISKTIIKKLIKEAKRAREMAYAPYSKFKVGAAVLADNNNIFTGCNVENVSYGLTICAERIAISKAISEGCKKIKAIAVIADTKEPVSPCGACRQFIMEFNPDTLVIMGTLDRKIHTTTIKELLPYNFKF